MQNGLRKQSWFWHCQRWILHTWCCFLCRRCGFFREILKQKTERRRMPAISVQEKFPFSSFPYVSAVSEHLGSLFLGRWRPRGHGPAAAGSRCFSQLCRDVWGMARLLLFADGRCTPALLGTRSTVARSLHTDVLCVGWFPLKGTKCRALIRGLVQTLPVKGIFQK